MMINYLSTRKRKKAVCKNIKRTRFVSWKTPRLRFSIESLEKKLNKATWLRNC